MPKKQVVTETRLDPAHMAANMYSERVKGDAKMEKAAIYGRNPDARELYFKGVQDTLICLEEWAKMKLSKDVMNLLISYLVEQTKDGSSQQAH